MESISKVQDELDVAGGKSSYSYLTSKVKDYETVERLALDLGLQWEVLMESKLTVLDYPPSCVRVYENGHFGLDLARLRDKGLLLEVTEDGALIKRPIKNNERMAPELLLTVRLPAVCSPKVALYALKGLCVEQLGADHSLSAIGQTKLFFLLERCSRPVPEERCFIFI